MSAQRHAQVEKTATKIETIEVEEAKTTDVKEELKGITDDLLDDIDTLLAETEAQGFTAASYEQRGGE